MTDLLPCVEIEPAKPAVASVIWLHGLGADGHDFEPIATEYAVPLGMPVRFVFPNAPTIPITVNGGALMPGWYDIEAFGEGNARRCNREQLEASARAVHALIDREIARGVPSHKILLAGFSQGGAVNYHAALTYPQQLAGLVAMSTYFPTADTVRVSLVERRLPILICHGSEDPLLTIKTARDSRRSLEALGFDPIFRTYVMGHEVCKEELTNILVFMGNCLTQPEN